MALSNAEKQRRWRERHQPTVWTRAEVEALTVERHARQAEIERLRAAPATPEEQFRRLVAVWDASGMDARLKFWATVTGRA